MPEFVPGRDLSRGFYEEVVGPLFATIRHSAALVGTGSDVLGFDTERSTDHAWGPRMHVFVEPRDLELARHLVDGRLPEEFRGWPVRYGWDETPISHHVVVTTLDEWLVDRLGVDPRGEITPRDWLGVPQQILLEVTRGAVFHDDLELRRVRATLAWYPDDVWLWLLACQWRRIDQEEPLVGRTAEVGDELGSRLLAARLVRDAMRLCFLQERRYAPYGKWLGTAFRELDADAALGVLFQDVLSAANYGARETALVAAMRTLAERHNALGATEPLDTSIRVFHSRPFRVLGSGRFAEACLARVTDPWLRSLPEVGAIDQFVDSTDVLSKPDVFREASVLFERWGDRAGAG